MEFENLVWASLDDPAAQRAQMFQNIEYLEEAKFGGLCTPADLARQGIASRILTHRFIYLYIYLYVYTYTFTSGCAWLFLS